ncbi:MAG: polysaccharide biosynthesis protein, partial [Acidobacteria bacterium]|nr:polysaccharide biosynthesis protein [Acidobacteriota bacterium]
WGLNNGWWRFVSLPEVIEVVLANALGSAVSTALILTLAPPGFPMSLYVLEFLLCCIATVGIRVCARVLFVALNRKKSTVRQKVLIYGAGEAGSLLAREIDANPSLGYRIVGFIDDDHSKKRMSIQGALVLGGRNELAAVARRFDVHQVLVAMPSATGTQMVSVLEACQKAGLKFQTIPTFGSMIRGHALASQIREVAVEDLLARAPVESDRTPVSAKLNNRVVLVTGAAGSIGSELCRQIAGFQPRAIVGFEIGESALFELDLEMRRTHPGVAFHPEIGSIQNPRRLAEIFARYAPSVVYHAAAYKHVPMMEAHVFEAVENNVFGTYNVAMAAATHHVADFIMISSDKAVRPSSIMGATKRVAELLMLALEDQGTRYIAVRFGNVLGSSGSVVPLFKRQIAAGGPLTVTHPEMRRYFMTISEAVQLVLQASTVGTGGDIFVLDMGEPVKIVDLARNLILLSGLVPDKDIAIEFTGVRPGEKLHEDLNAFNEDTIQTVHEKIRIFAGNGIPKRNTMAYLDELREICLTRDTTQLVLTLKEIVPDYNPGGQLLRRALKSQSAGAEAVLAAS